MRKILITLVAVGVLLSARTASQALTITVAPTGQNLSDPLVTQAPNDWVGGIQGPGGFSGPDAGVYMDQLVAAGPLDITDQGQFTVGTRYGIYFSTFPAFVYGPNTVSVLHEADYSILVHTDTDMVDKKVIVRGTLDENYGLTKGSNPGVNDAVSGSGNYTALLGLGNVYVDGVAIAATKTTLPSLFGAQEFLKIPLVFAGNQPVNLYVLYNKPMSPGLYVAQAATTPGNSLEGYVDTVPEPGSVAMLCGSGVVSTLFVIRRRRKA
jgi:hypothetical protein